MQKIYFSDFFGVSSDLLEEEGLFNISLLNDLPLFIDPFLIFCSEKEDYQKLHEEIVRYMVYLRNYAMRNPFPSKAMLQALYQFPEVRQNYLGFCTDGNEGSALGRDFAMALHSGLKDIFSNFGEERITMSQHVEKLCLIKDGVGKDCISDFITNLIKHYLLEVTQDFAKRHLDSSLCRKFTNIPRVTFDYERGVWKAGSYYLPFYNNDYVLLTPTDLLVRSDTWINRTDLYEAVAFMGESLPDEVLRFQVNGYFTSLLAKNPTKEEKIEAAKKTILQFPEVIDHYIRTKEEDEQGAMKENSQAVEQVKTVFINQLRNLVAQLEVETDFYKKPITTHQEAMQRVQYLKHIIEDCDGYRWFYDGEQPIRREADLHIMYKLACFDTIASVDSEVNNGRGPVDFKVSNGRKDATLVEFKLTRTLKRNLEKQVDVYKNANQTNRAIKVVLYFTDAEEEKTHKILNDLGLTGNPDIVLIDARANKVQASKAT